jgi:hypothetical protein
MRKLLRSIALVTVILFTAANAWAGSETFQGFQVIKFLLNGKEISSTKPSILVDGVPYVPAQAVADGMRGKMAWDQGKSSVDLTVTDSMKVLALETDNKRLSEKVASLEAELKAIKDSVGSENDDTKPAAAGSIGTSRKAPAPVGTSINASLELTSVYPRLPFNATFTVLEVVRGDQAYQRIKAANQFNDVPAAGKEYVLAKLRIKVTAIDDEESAVKFNKYMFTAVSSAGRDYPRVSTVDPEPEIEAQLYKGASHEGWVSFMVEKSDTAPLLTFARDSQGKNGYWFELTPKSSTAKPEPAPTTPKAPVQNGQTSSTTTTITTAADLQNYLNENHSKVSTKLGDMTIRYEVTFNDRTWFGFDYWIRMVYAPTSYFLDLDTKNNIKAEDRAASLATLRAHARTVYDVAAKAFPGTKIQGQYYRSWYEYPSIQVGFEARQYLTWQNYNDNLLGSGNTYERATLSTFHFEPMWDDTKF